MYCGDPSPQYKLNLEEELKDTHSRLHSYARRAPLLHSPDMVHPNGPLSPKDLEYAFIKVTFEEEGTAQQGASAADPFYDPWVDQGALPCSLLKNIFIQLWIVIAYSF